MVGFHGRFGPKQYVPDKPTKYGIKAWLRVSMDMFMTSLCIYTGSDTLASANPDYSTLPQPARVVLPLLGDYMYSDKGHRVFTDRYYTIIPLALTLKEHSTGFTGTSMKNRVGLPDEIREKNFHLRDVR